MPIAMPANPPVIGRRWLAALSQRYTSQHCLDGESFKAVVLARQASPFIPPSFEQLNSNSQP
jgi:hypothetical protein